MEKEKVKEPEAEQLQEEHYDRNLRRIRELQLKATTKKVVLRAKEIPWRQSRMGYVKRYLNWEVEDSALSGWTVFVHEIHRHSGKHCHQGGVSLFVIEGKGYTVVDGQRVDWEAGDLIILPIRPGGIVHQHFNADPGSPCRWIAWIHSPFGEAMGNLFRHEEDSPEFKKAGPAKEA